MSSYPAQAQSSIHEPARELPVSGAYEVVVVGGGIAGVAAAVAAARNGASVCLVDKQSALGGLATLGNVILWLPLCDGRGHQVVGGLGEELLKLAVADLGQDRPSAQFLGIPPCWRPAGDPQLRQKVRYRVSFNPSAYLFALEKLVVDAGIALLYDTRFSAIQREEARISHVIFENKGGRFALAAGCVIDATGDADVCFAAGEATESLDANVPAGWFYVLRAGSLALNFYSEQYCPRGMRDGLAGPFFCGDRGTQVTGQILATRRGIREQLARLRAQHPEEDLQLFNPATIACLRMTRRLVGEFSLDERQVHQWFEDTIGLIGDWRQPGPVYAIPLRSLRAVRTVNLLAAGRCISVAPTAWEVTRALPGCAVTGEAAGTAAALAVRCANGAVHKLSINELQHQLRAQGVLLDPALVREAPAS